MALSSSQVWQMPKIPKYHQSINTSLRYSQVGDVKSPPPIPMSNYRNFMVIFYTSHADSFLPVIYPQNNSYKIHFRAEWWCHHRSKYLLWFVELPRVVCIARGGKKGNRWRMLWKKKICKGGNAWARELGLDSTQLYHIVEYFHSSLPLLNNAKKDETEQNILEPLIFLWLLIWVSEWQSVFLVNR